MSCYGVSISPTHCLQFMARFRCNIYPSFISALSFSDTTTAGSFRESTYNSYNISLSHVLNRFYICPHPRPDKMPKVSEVNEKSAVLHPWDVEQWSMCKKTCKWCSSGWSEPVLANSPALKRKAVGLGDIQKSFHPKKHGLLGTMCQHAIKVDAVNSHCGAC